MKPRRSLDSLSFPLCASTPQDNRSDHHNNNNNNKQPDDCVFRHIVQWLAELSLADYRWRSGLFKTNQAERMVEESLARLRGESAAYVRPMDAPSAGLLGCWERDSVAWLSAVFDEEGRRAAKIVAAAGLVVRPSDSNDAERGPLGALEAAVVEFFAQIRRAETERVRTKTLRPKDLDESSRGPLGRLEWDAARTLDEFWVSENLRAQQSRARGGAMVRPIDVPGPLGEMELRVADIVQAERLRVRESRRNSGRMVSPKDAALRGPLGAAEASAYATMQSLSAEEMERLRNIRRTMAENRPMEINRDSLLGIVEALVVGILRAPRILQGVAERVFERRRRSDLDEADQKIVRQKSAAAEATQTPTDE